MSWLEMFAADAEKRNAEYGRRHRQKKQAEATTINQGQNQKTEK